MFFDTLSLLGANIKKKLEGLNSSYLTQASFMLLLLAEMAHASLVVRDHGEVTGATETLNQLCNHYTADNFQAVIDADSAPEGVSWLAGYGFDVGNIVKDPMVIEMAKHLVRYCADVVSGQASNAELTYSDFGVPNKEGGGIAEKLATALLVFGPESPACGP
jgi:hypothetical protein